TSAATTVAPDSAKWSAEARPIPEAAPVTMTTPVSWIMASPISVPPTGISARQRDRNCDRSDLLALVDIEELADRRIAQIVPGGDREGHQVVMLDARLIHFLADELRDELH